MATPPPPTGTLASAAPAPPPPPPTGTLASAAPAPPPPPPQSPHTPSTSAVKSEVPAAAAAADSTPIVAAAAATPPPPSRSPEPSAAVSYTITIPSCSGWFSWDEIHETERRLLPEFFDGRFSSRNPSVYKYYRDSIIRQFRAQPWRKLTFTEARRGLIGDVGSVRRVFDFLEEWGLINYTPSAKPKERREAAAAKEEEEGDTAERKEGPKRLCTNCRSVCGLTCFTTDKADIILCSRCYVRGNYRPGLSNFKRVDNMEELKTEWTDKENLHLLEAIVQYGEEWKKVSEHVGSRSAKDCVARFIKLPFGEQFLRPIQDGEDSGPNRSYESNDEVAAEHGGESLKRRRLTPLADASNPIMAQVAFLSGIAGSDLAEASARAAISALHEVHIEKSKFNNDIKVEALLEEAAAKAQSQLEEEQDVEKSLSDIVEVQMKEIQDKIVHFEALESLLEKEWRQLRYMKDSLFNDQLAILQHQNRAKFTAIEDRTGNKFRTTSDVNIVEKQAN
uniref:SWI/SNF complex subunit SWI3B n=1 Tax=Ananas comosus var. bracteatus TaxID=296719 RepID=A0A6V7PKF2_ANACO|nr:unnamed protein product [Ananas comosus var. bracteatus]